MGLRKIGILILAVAALTGMVHALTQGDFSAVAIGAFALVVCFWIFTDKRIQRHQ